MALASAVGVPISPRTGVAESGNSTVVAVLWAAFLTFLVAGPWLLPGYLFGTDWPGPRRFDFPTGASSSAALQAVLAVLSLALGGEATGKLFVIAILFASGAFAFRASPTRGFIPGATAAVIYEVNPFVYGRLHYGQLFLLAGYAVLPWVAARLRAMLLEPRIFTALVAATSLTLLGILSLHLFVAAAALFGPLLIASVASAHEKLPYSKRLVLPLLLAGVATLGASSYWIVPLLSARGPEGTSLAGISAGDLNAFAAIPDERLGLLPNLLGLYGFWAEAAGRFTPMKAFALGWPGILGLLLLLCGLGVFGVFRGPDRQLKAWVAGLLAAAVVALILEAGVSHPLTAGLVQRLDAHISLYRGMRDAGKWAVVLALVYSQLAALGAATVFRWIRERPPGRVGPEWLSNIATGLVLALPIYYGNGLLYGAHSEIKSSHYPQGWYAADRVLASDSNPGRTLFLPWHEYMAFDFIHNQNKVVGPPGPAFFTVPILVSSDPEVPGISPPDGPDQTAVTNLVRDGARGAWAQTLADRHVKYVLVARELDWAYFKFLDDQPGLIRVGDFGSIMLYRNELVS